MYYQLPEKNDAYEVKNAKKCSLDIFAGENALKKINFPLEIDFLISGKLHTYGKALLNRNKAAFSKVEGDPSERMSLKEWSKELDKTVYNVARVYSFTTHKLPSRSK